MPNLSQDEFADAMLRLGRIAGDRAERSPRERDIPFASFTGLFLAHSRYVLRSAVTPRDGTESIGAREFQRCSIPGGGGSPASRVPSPPEGALYEPYERSFPKRLRSAAGRLEYRSGMCDCA